VKARRIDVMVCNTEMQARIIEAGSKWTAGVPTHAINVLHLAAGQAKKVSVWQGAKWQAKENITEAQWDQVVQGKEEAWYQALDEKDPDKCWNILESLLLEAHQAAEGEELGPVAGRVIQESSEAEVGQDGCALRQEQKQVRTCLKRLNTLRILMLTGQKQAAARVRRKLHRNEIAAEACRLGTVASDNEVERMAVSVEMHAETVSGQVKDSRKQKWKEWVDESWEERQSALYAWIKKGKVETVHKGAHTDANGIDHIGINATVSACDEAWWGFWKPGTPLPPMEYWQSQQGVPADSRQRFRMIQLAELQQVIKRASSKKAAGADGWCMQHFKLWPTGTLHWVLSFLRVVEAAQRWPSALCKNLVCLLPNKGEQPTAALPTRARPVMLLAGLYRLWGPSGRRI